MLHQQSIAQSASDVSLTLSTTDYRPIHPATPLKKLLAMGYRSPPLPCARQVATCTRSRMRAPARRSKKKYNAKLTINRPIRFGCLLNSIDHGLSTVTPSHAPEKTIDYGLSTANLNRPAPYLSSLRSPPYQRGDKETSLLYPNATSHPTPPGRIPKAFRKGRFLVLRIGWLFRWGQTRVFSSIFLLFLGLLFCGSWLRGGIRASL